MGTGMEVDPDIRRARVPHGEAYASRAAYRTHLARVLPRAWQYVGHAGQLPEPGWQVPATLFAGSLDEPVLLTRGEDHRVRVLSNVCTHRGKRLLETPACGSTVRCGYHGRRFDLTGRCRFMPEFEAVPEFPEARDHLPELAVGRWGPLIFASLDPAVPFDRWIQPVRERLAFFEPERMTADPATARDWDVEACWTLYCDNYLEGFHIPFVHPGLAEVLDWRRYETHLFEQVSLQIGVASGEGEGAFELPAGHPHAGRAVAGFYFFGFPTTMINLYPWGLSLNVVEPRGPDRTRVRFLPFVADPARRGEGAGAALDTVELEDEAVVKSVQGGVRSRLYRPGRYSPTQERAVHHFHRLLAEAGRARG